jgi:hypothetical protein
MRAAALEHLGGNALLVQGAEEDRGSRLQRIRKIYKVSRSRRLPLGGDGALAAAAHGRFRVEAGRIWETVAYPGRRSKPRAAVLPFS